MAVGDDLNFEAVESFAERLVDSRILPNLGELSARAEGTRRQTTPAA